MCAQARRRFAQVIHMVVHSKACNTFSCQAGRQQRVSVPVLARHDRHAGRGSGLGLDDIAHDGGHRMLAAHPAGQAARAPRRLPAVTLTVIPPAARPRHTQAARAPSPPALAPRPARPRAGAGGAGPRRRPGSAADHRPATADAGALAPGGVSARATARHPVLRARAPTVLHGPVADAAAPALTASGRGAATQEPRPCSVRTLDHRGWHSRACRGAGPGNDVPAGQNQARPLHV